MRQEEHFIRRIVDEIVDAWNRGDMEAFVRPFAEDAQYVTGSGVRLDGRAAILRELASQSTGPSSPQRVLISDLSVRMLGLDAAMALARWRMDAAGRAGLFTLVATAAPEGWRIVAFHNTDSAA